MCMYGQQSEITIAITKLTIIPTKYIKDFFPTFPVQQFFFILCVRQIKIRSDR